MLTNGALYEQDPALGTGLNVGFSLLSPAGTIVSASAVTDLSGNPTVYAVVANTHNLWEHSPALPGDGWMIISSGSFQQVSAGLNGAGQALVYGVLTDGSLWEQNPALGTGLNVGWTQLSGTGGAPSAFLSAAAGRADTVFAISASDHSLWLHNLAGWQQVSIGQFCAGQPVGDRGPGSRVCLADRRRVLEVQCRAVAGQPMGARDGEWPPRDRRGLQLDDVTSGRFDGSPMVGGRASKVGTHRQAVLGTGRFTLSSPASEKGPAMRNAAETLCILAIAVLAAAAPADRLTAADAPKTDGWTPALMMKVKQIGSVQVSPDGKQVVYTVREAVMDGNRSDYRTQLYLYRADGGGQLTQGDASCDDPQWSPDGRWIAFLTARSGKKDSSG